LVQKGRELIKHLIHLRTVNFYWNITFRKMNGIKYKNIDHVGIHGEMIQSNSAF